MCPVAHATLDHNTDDAPPDVISGLFQTLYSAMSRVRDPKQKLCKYRRSDAVPTFISVPLSCLKPTETRSDIKICQRSLLVCLFSFSYEKSRSYCLSLPSCHTTKHDDLQQIKASSAAILKMQRNIKLLMKASPLICHVVPGGLNLGKKISVPKDVMMEELNLSSNRGSRMFQERQKRAERFTLENTASHVHDTTNVKSWVMMHSDTTPNHWTCCYCCTKAF